MTAGPTVRGTHMLYENERDNVSAGFFFNEKKEAGMVKVCVHVSR